MNVFEIFAKLKIDKTEYEQGLKDAKSSVSKIGSGIASAGKGIASGIGTAMKAGIAAIGAATAAVGAFAVSSVEAGKRFDSSMSQVAATMGYTVDELNDETSEAAQTFNKLSDFAQEMGRTTAFSASEAADALNYMALAGYDADKSMDMLPNVLNLAAAGCMDLATASDMVTDAQSALDLTTEETKVMVDQMAAASSKSNTSVSQLGSAILTIGATAQNVKGGTQELATVLGVLADNGIKGSEGGTHLRNAILSLQTPTKQGTAALSELGMTYADMYDEAGNMRSLPEIFQQMSGAMEGMTQQSKDAIISGIFNKTDLAAINALLNTQTSKWESLSEAIGDSAGAAERMAGTQLDNLEGDITLFKSALEGAQIAVSNKLTPALRGFVRFGSKGLSELTEGFSEGGLAGAMEVFKKLISEAASGLAEALPAFIDAGVDLLIALVSGIAEALPELQKAGEQIINTLLTKICEIMGIEASGTALEMIGDLIQGFSAAFPELVKSGVAAVNEFLSGIIEDIPAVMTMAADLIWTLADGIAIALPQLIPVGIDAILTFIDAALDNIDKVVDAAVRIIEGLIGGIVNALPKLMEKAPVIIGKLCEALLALLPQIVRVGIDLIVGLVAGITKSIPAAVKGIKDLGKRILDGIKEFFGIHSPSTVFEGLGVNLIDGLINGIKKMVSKAGEAIKNIGDTIGKGFEDVVKNGATWAGDLINNFVGGITNGVNKVGDAVKKIADKIKGLIGFSEPEDPASPLHNFHTFAPDMMDLFIKGIRDSESALQSQIARTFDVGDIIEKKAATEAGNVFNAGGMTINIYPRDTALADEIVNELQWKIGRNINSRRAAWGV